MMIPPLSTSDKWVVLIFAAPPNQFPVAYWASFAPAFYRESCNDRVSRDRLNICKARPALRESDDTLRIADRGFGKQS